jgi:hypothetical protein
MRDCGSVTLQFDGAIVLTNGFIVNQNAFTTFRSPITPQLEELPQKHKINFCAIVHRLERH